MWRVSLLLLSLLWSMSNSQTAAPYVTFFDAKLPNHAFVNLHIVGDPDVGRNDGVHCNTDLETCCRGAYGTHRGDWYFPDGSRLPFSSGSGDIYQQRLDKGVDVRRRNTGDRPSGIYRCDIHVSNDPAQSDASVYVGLYYSGGIHYYRNIKLM